LLGIDKNMLPVDLIIFDLDGTLIDSRQDIANAVNFSLNKVGRGEKTIAEISSYIGMGLDDLIRKSLGESKSHLFDKAKARFEEYYREHCTDNSVLYPQVRETLEYFRNKRKIIITNRNYEFARLALKATGISGYFEAIMGGDDIGCMKPSSCPLDKLMHKFNINNKQKAIIVGDMDIDVLTGRAAGIITCAVTYGIGRKEQIVKAKPDYIIDNLRQLKDIIN
jgi:phosphoglycolate phosphatase